MADDDAPKQRKTVICGFCETKLTADGEIIKLGDPAKELRDALESNKQLRDKLTAAETTIADLREQVKKLKDGGDGGGRDDDTLV